MLVLATRRKNCPSECCAALPEVTQRASVIRAWLCVRRSSWGGLMRHW